MRGDVVVDVGNTRIKWGLCSHDAVVAACTLSPDDPGAWQKQQEQWALAESVHWVLASVHPQRCEHLAEWIRSCGGTARILDKASVLPLRVALEHPDRVGMDRLLDAVAANHRRPPGTSAVVVDVGSAVTVDRVDQTGAFVGGAILPGFRLMAQALHDHTALLPLIDRPTGAPAAVGTSTDQAIASGTFWAVVGGVQRLIREMSMGEELPPTVFLTGGDAPLLPPVLDCEVSHWPWMTLEGIRLSAENLP